MKRFLISGLIAGLMVTPALADDFTETIDLVLEAYESGDIAGAKDELDYAGQLLQAMKGSSFQAFLPEALDGWNREITDDNGDAAAMAMFGGGVLASADYTKGDDTVSIQLMADNAMVSSLGGMLGNTAMMGMLGKVVRIKRKSFVDQDGEIQGMIGDVLIQVSGNASKDDKIAYIELLDFKALDDY